MFFSRRNKPAPSTSETYQWSLSGKRESKWCHNGFSIVSPEFQRQNQYFSFSSHYPPTRNLQFSDCQPASHWLDFLPCLPSSFIKWLMHGIKWKCVGASPTHTTMEETTLSLINAGLSRRHAKWLLFFIHFLQSQTFLARHPLYSNYFWLELTCLFQEGRAIWAQILPPAITDQTIAQVLQQSRQRPCFQFADPRQLWKLFTLHWNSNWNIDKYYAFKKHLESHLAFVLLCVYVCMYIWDLQSIWNPESNVLCE